MRVVPPLPAVSLRLLCSCEANINMNISTANSKVLFMCINTNYIYKMSKIKITVILH